MPSLAAITNGNDFWKNLSIDGPATTTKNVQRTPTFLMTVIVIVIVILIVPVVIGPAEAGVSVAPVSVRGKKL